jgi:hypothetical protein
VEWARQWPPALGDVYNVDLSPGTWAAIMVILWCEVEGLVKREMAVWRPVTPAPRIMICLDWDAILKEETLRIFAKLYLQYINETNIAFI